MQETTPLDPITFYKCLAEETRLHSLMLILLEEELCVCELMAALDQSQPKISRHLAQLRQAGILNDRRQGQWVYYSLHEGLDDWARLVLQVTTRDNIDQIGEHIARLEGMRQRPDRTSACS